MRIKYKERKQKYEYCTSYSGNYKTERTDYYERYNYTHINNNKNSHGDGIIIIVILIKIKVAA